jgi:hypothetical protein
MLSAASACACWRWRPSTSTRCALPSCSSASAPRHNSWQEENVETKKKKKSLMHPRCCEVGTLTALQDPYFMKNHLGSYECKLCLTLHTNEGSYLAHTQGKKHQDNVLVYCCTAVRCGRECCLSITLQCRLRVIVCVPELGAGSGARQRRQRKRRRARSRPRSVSLSRSLSRSGGPAIAVRPGRECELCGCGRVDEEEHEIRDMRFGMRCGMCPFISLCSPHVLRVGADGGQ